MVEKNAQNFIFRDSNIILGLAVSVDDCHETYEQSCWLNLLYYYFVILELLPELHCHCLNHQHYEEDYESLG